MRFRLKQIRESQNVKCKILNLKVPGPLIISEKPLQVIFYTFLAFLFLFTLGVPPVVAQYDTLKVVEVDGRILQQLNGSIQQLPNAKLRVKGIGKFTTNETGNFAFQVPIFEYNRFDEQIEVSITVDGYDIISPLNGTIEMDTADYQMTLDLTVVGDELSANYRQQLDKLSRRLNRLKADNAMSVGRLNALNDSLLNNIKNGEYQRQQLESTIANLNSDLANATAGNEALKKQLSEKQAALTSLSEQINDLNQKVLEAKQEKYLRQEKHLRAITSDLKDYLIRTKDVHELLEHVEEYFPARGNPEYVKSYNSSLTAYNKILTQLNEEHKTYIQNVSSYWSAPAVAAQLDETFQILFNQLHFPKLQPALSEVNSYLRKRKAKKADQVAHAAFHDMYPIILNLEKSINKTTAMLKKNF
ncbi:MAG: hypothetical protein AAF960_24115 [Bacteroidota bacterium]